MLVEDTTFDFQIAPSPPTDGRLSLDHDAGFDGSLFVGYDLGGFRLEAEASYKRADLDNFGNIGGPIASTGSPHPAGTHPAGGGRTSALSFMVNGLLDFGDDDGLSVFAGGGVGVAKVDYNRLRAFKDTGTFLDDSDTRFAWQLIAGVRSPISRTVDVHLRYRFFNVEDVRVAGVSGLPIQGGHFRSHSILGGITFNFGAPPPPGPPPPPPPPPPPASEVPPPPPPPIAEGPFIVFFDWDSAELTAQAKTILDNAAAAYRQTGTSHIMLAGHADRSGPAGYNVKLSAHRANNVKDYLSKAGVPASAMMTQAFGEASPPVPTADGVREPQNRRVEITFGPGSGG